MSASTENTAQNLKNQTRESRIELLKRIMKPINANRKQSPKPVNCGHVSLRLDQLLHNLNALSLKQESQLDIEPVPTDNAGQWFYYDPTHKKTRLANMNTNSQALIERCALETVDVKTLIDLASSDDAQSKPMINLTLGDKTVTDKLFLEAATYTNIVDKLKALPRRVEDNIAFGFLLYTHETANGKIGKNLHIANFFVDSNNEVYFLDAQPEDLYISDKPMPGYIPDIFYMRSSAPLFIENTLAPNDQMIIKQEPVAEAASSSSSSSNPAVSIPASTSLNPASQANQNGATAQRRPRNPTELRRLSPEQMALLSDEATAGNLVSLVELATCRAYGIGVPKDETLAFQNFELAAKGGLAIAQGHLGVCYAMGIGVAKNPVLAFQNLQLAAKRGDALAQCNLGRCYEYGIVVAENPVLAFQNYQSAALQGLVSAQGALERIKVAREKAKQEAYEKAKLQQERQAQLQVAAAEVRKTEVREAAKTRENTVNDLLEQMREQTKQMQRLEANQMQLQMQMLEAAKKSEQENAILKQALLSLTQSLHQSAPAAASATTAAAASAAATTSAAAAATVDHSVKATNSANGAAVAPVVLSPLTATPSSAPASPAAAATSATAANDNLKRSFSSMESASLGQEDVSEGSPNKKAKGAFKGASK